MAYIRRLPSGKWQATVYMPNGRRTTKSHRLKSFVEKWAKDLEASYNRGETRDPRAGEILIRDWFERWFAARGGELPTQRRHGPCDSVTRWLLCPQRERPDAAARHKHSHPKHQRDRQQPAP